MSDEPTREESERSGESSGNRSIGSYLVPGVIRRRLIAKTLVAIVAILLLTAAISVFFYVGISDQLEGQVDDQVEQTTELHANVLDTWLNDRELELEDISRDDVLTTGDSDEISRYLEGQAYTGEFSELYLVDRETGEVIGSSSDDAVGEDMLDRMGQDLGSPPSFMTTEQYTNFEGDEAIAIGQQRIILDEHLLIGEVDAHDPGPNLPQGIDGANTVVVTQDGEPIFGDESVDSSVIEPGVEGIAKVSHDGSLYSYIPSYRYSSYAGEDVYVVTRTPEDVAFAVRDEVQLSFIVTIVLTGFVFVAVGLVGGRSVSSELTRLRNRAQTMEEGDLSVDLETGRVDEIGSLYDSFAAMRDSLREQIREAQAAREESEAERERVQRINDQLERAAHEYGAAMGAAADGDLAVRADTEVENETMREIGEDFNEMLDEIEATVADLQAFATQVAIASEQVTASSEEVHSASEQISDSVQEISAGAERQNASLQQATSEMSTLSTTTEEIAASSNEVADLAARTANTGEAGREAAQDAIESMTETETEAERAVEEIRALESEVGQIDDLIERIQQIAEQTNMLALNANIEASRSASGQDGDGFGAVAQEIKELSNDAKVAANQVESRLESIREQTVRSAEEVEETSARLETASEQVEEAVEALEEIASFATETNTGVQEISAASEEQAATTQEVVAIVDEAATISEETTAEAESVAAATEEQTTALTEVSGSASQLSQQATQLSQALDHFETDVDNDGGIVGDDEFELEADERDESAVDGDGEADAAAKQDGETDSSQSDDPLEEPVAMPADESTATDDERTDSTDADSSEPASVDEDDANVFEFHDDEADDS
ncbi:methyl-accepting chemotaxis protein [Natrarchaeobius oligotrophus]|uniref:HAMP domain-containing protein n=1 Tax=Natrarchaeobius chitinivorans TaxID=1679083 RepID=A0A3N6M8E8_NATCH|nr:HAMP domain-containing methyl-accepting chemotaxis protein [Natrarchaeobius chitinivorans]RQG99973.1 HAMP domain-containing protein [Natrarchaeobius chitinivorans]